MQKKWIVGVEKLASFGCLISLKRFCQNIISEQCFLELQLRCWESYFKTQCSNFLTICHRGLGYQKMKRPNCNSRPYCFGRKESVSRMRGVFCQHILRSNENRVLTKQPGESAKKFTWISYTWKDCIFFELSSATHMVDFTGLLQQFSRIIITIIIIQHLYSAIVSYAGCRGACGAS